MAERLKAVVRFLAVPAGGTVSQAHGLTIGDGVAVTPDELTPGTNGNFFSPITANSTTVTVTNIDGVVHDLDVLCECWHSVERAFGGTPTVDLVPKPFVPDAARGVALLGLFTAALAADVSITDSVAYTDLLSLAFTVVDPNSTIEISGEVAGIFGVFGAAARASFGVVRFRLQIDGVDANSGAQIWIPANPVGGPFPLNLPLLRLQSLVAGAHTAKIVWFNAPPNAGESASVLGALIPSQNQATLVVKEWQT